ncbi:MAG: hypothetical protein H3C45_00550 [Bacteroidia bacterium]|nr:hypothetical protein [Bacteroidia bacterium]
MNYIKFDYKAFIFLTLTFILMTVIGTLTHELGHYSVSKYLGYEASINYQRSSYWDNDLNEYFKHSYDKYSNEIKNNLDFPGKQKYQTTIKKYQADNFWIILGGPLQTILTGSIGFLLLLLFRKKCFTTDNVKLTGWTLIFISLFWLRQVANLFMAIMTFIVKGQPFLSGDEMRLAYYLDINIWIIQVITGLFGIAILFIVLKLLPKSLVLTFLLSGLTGGLLGYYLWLIKFGQYIMP